MNIFGSDSPQEVRPNVECKTRCLDMRSRTVASVGDDSSRLRSDHNQAVPGLERFGGGACGCFSIQAGTNARNCNAKAARAQTRQPRRKTLRPGQDRTEAGTPKSGHHHGQEEAAPSGWGSCSGAAKGQCRKGRSKVLCLDFSPLGSGRPRGSAG